MAVKLGPVTRQQMARVALVWHQGQHVLITGATGSGKTQLARELLQIRLDRGGSVVVFLAKLQPDETITRYYKDFTRWKTWKTHPSVVDKRILLWPDVEGKDTDEATVILKREYMHALREISKVGKWTVLIDEGLWTTDPQGLGLGKQISAMFQLIRSAHGTMIIAAQRPSNLPLSIYANVSEAFIGRASERDDVKRLASLSTSIPANTLANIIRHNGLHDFTWVDCNGQSLPERVNLSH